MVRRTNTPVFSSPGLPPSLVTPLIGGTEAFAPVASTRVSYGNSCFLPSDDSAWTTFFSWSTLVTLVPRSRPILLFFRRSSGASMRLVSSGMTPDMPYGRPHLEYCG